MIRNALIGGAFPWHVIGVLSGSDTLRSLALVMLIAGLLMHAIPALADLLASKPEIN